MTSGLWIRRICIGGQALIVGYQGLFLNQHLQMSILPPLSMRTCEEQNPLCLLGIVVSVWLLGDKHLQVRL
jgi:hypothetical protein